MSTDRRGRPPLAPLLAALRVRRNATIGFGAGIALAGLAFGYRVLLVDPLGGQATSPWLFAALAVVLAFAFGALTTLILTLGTVCNRLRTAQQGDGRP